MKKIEIEIPDDCILVQDGDKYIIRKEVPKPRTWEEFCENYPLRKDDFWISDGGRIRQVDSQNIGKCRTYKNWCTSKQEAEAFLALMQLRQLRKAWVGEWEQKKIGTAALILHNTNEDKIIIDYDTTWISGPLSFPSKEMAEDFLNCFRDLCETAKILL